MRPIEEAIEEAQKILSEAECSSFVIIAKDPDSDEFLLRQGGSRGYALGAMDLSRDIIKSHALGNLKIRKQ